MATETFALRVVGFSASFLVFIETKPSLSLFWKMGALSRSTPCILEIMAVTMAPKTAEGTITAKA